MARHFSPVLEKNIDYGGPIFMMGDNPEDVYILTWKRYSILKVFSAGSLQEAKEHQADWKAKHGYDVDLFELVA